MTITQCPRCSSTKVRSELVGRGSNIKRARYCHNCGHSETVGNDDRWVSSQLRERRCEVCETRLEGQQTQKVCRGCRSSVHFGASLTRNRYHVTTCLSCDKPERMPAHHRICPQCRTTKEYRSYGYGQAGALR